MTAVADALIKPAVNSAPAIETPIVPPMLRENWLALVTTPRCSQPTADCAARIVATE